MASTFRDQGLASFQPQFLLGQLFCCVTEGILPPPKTTSFVPIVVAS